VVGRIGGSVAATHGYTIAFDVAAGLFALGAVLAVTMLPSRTKLERIREMNDITSGFADDVANSADAISEPVHSGV
jgi:hydrogenase maturation factor HypE